MGPDTVDETPDNVGPTRRDVLKKAAVGAGVAGVVWTAPAVVGLSMTPAFAAAGSKTPPVCAGDFTFDVKLPGNIHSPSSSIGTASGKACTDLTLQVSSHYDLHPPGNQSICGVQEPRSYQTISINKIAGGAGCTINAVTYDVPDAPGHGKGTSTNPFDGGVDGRNTGCVGGCAAGCSDFGTNDQYGAYLVHDRTDVTGPDGTPFHFQAHSGYTLTANGIYSVFASDPDQSNDLGPASGGGVAHVKITCT
jgi:hypothetical protein